MSDTVKIEIDMPAFNDALRAYMLKSRQGMKQVCIQRALNIAGHAFEQIPPTPIGNVDSQKAKVWNYLRDILHQPMKVAKSSGVKRRQSRRVRMQKLSPAMQQKMASDILRGRVSRKGPTKGQNVGFKGNGDHVSLYKRVKRIAGRRHPLRRVNLIMQKRRAMKGLPGQYGYEAFRAAEAFTRTAVASVGYLKTPFLKVIRLLNPMARFKFPFAKTRGIIGSWSGTEKAVAGISIGAQTDKPFVEFQVTVDVRGPRKKNAETLLSNAINHGYQADTLDMVQHVADVLKGKR